MEIYQINAFTKNGQGGNPAGVVLGTKTLDRNAMLEITRKLGYSETAFVFDSSLADYKVRFFTTVEEIDLCGHATIATFNLLRNLDYIQSGLITQETRAGILEIVIKDDYVLMQQNKPIFSEKFTHDEIQNAFENTLPGSKLNKPIQIVSTGIKEIFLPMNDIQALNELQPNYEIMTSLSEKYEVAGLHAFTENTSENCDAICRNFAPRYGIKEEAATGTANGALACYLNKYSEDPKQNYKFEQGYMLERPSEIMVKLKLKENQVQNVYVGGSAVQIDS